MKTLLLEMIFDYACPYCYQAHLHMKAIRDLYPGLQLAFCPCEAHPGPEAGRLSSALALQGLYYCMDYGVNIWNYHDLMFQAFHVDGIDGNNLSAIADYLKRILDADHFKAVIRIGDYESVCTTNNQYVWETLALNAVPSYRIGTRTLLAVPGIGVSKDMLVSFMDDNLL